MAAEFDTESKMLFRTTKDVVTVKTFEDMKLKEKLLRGIYAYGECAWGGSGVAADCTERAFTQVLRSPLRSSSGPLRPF